MAEPIVAIFGHQGTNRTKNLDYLEGVGTGAATLAYNVPKSTPDVPRLEDGRLNSAFVHC